MDWGNHNDVLRRSESEVDCVVEVEEQFEEHDLRLRKSRRVTIGDDLKVSIYKDKGLQFFKKDDWEEFATNMQLRGSTQLFVKEDEKRIYVCGSLYMREIISITQCEYFG